MINLTQITILKISKQSKNANGEQYKVQTGRNAGKPFVKFSVQTSQFKKWPSKLVFEREDPVLLWKEGETHEVVIEENGDFLNFRLPSRLDRLEAKVEELGHLIAQISPNLPSPEGVVPNGKLSKAITDGYNEISQHHEDESEEDSLPF